MSNEYFSNNDHIKNQEHIEGNSDDTGIQGDIVVNLIGNIFFNPSSSFWTPRGTLNINTTIDCHYAH